MPKAPKKTEAAGGSESTPNLVNLGSDKRSLIRTGPLVGPGGDVRGVDDSNVLSNTTTTPNSLATRRGMLFVPAGGSKALSGAELEAVKDVADLAVNRAYFEFGYLKFGPLSPNAAPTAIVGQEAPPDLRAVPPGLNIVSDEMM